MRIYPVLRRVVEAAAAGAANFSVTTKPAIAISAVNSGTLEKPEVKPAFVVAEMSAKSARIPTNPAPAVSLLPITAVPDKPVVEPALGQTFRHGLAVATVDEPAFDIVQVTYALVRDVGGNAQAAVGTAWTNPGNAINGTNGKANGTPFATCAGSLGGNTNGIELSYADVSNKDELVISAATLDLFMSVVDATGLLCTTVVSYNIGAGLVTLETIVGAFTNIVTPRSYNLSAIINTWAKYNALQVRVVCTFAAASALSNASLDAIEIAMTAAKTDNPI